MTPRRAGTEHIGVNCAFVCHDGSGRVLLHQRGPDARDEQGVWDSGSGELEFGEEFRDCVLREVREELGTAPLEVAQVGVANNIIGASGRKRHWVTIQFAVRVDPEAAMRPEAGKLGDLAWFDRDSLPSALHPALPDLLRAAEDVLGWR